MEVISGMAPRPVTPSGGPSFPQRPASAPNSPARGFGGGGKFVDNNPNNTSISSFGSFGGFINRLPSQDSLDRSIHNDTSGNGKSTAQIVRDLKQSNSALSAKMASLEKKHMNELSDVTRSFEKRQAELELANKNMKKQLQQLEAFKKSSEMKLKEKDAALSKVKEESAFQRHTISGLKNDLYQLQSELDELEEHQQQQQGGGGDGARSKKRSQRSPDDEQREVDDLRKQLMMYEGYEAKMEEMQRQLDEANRKAESAATLASSRKIRPPLAPSSSRDSGDTHHNSEREAAMTEMHNKAMLDLQAEMDSKRQEFEQREAGLLAKLDHKTDVEQRLAERDETIAELEEKLDEYTEKLGELATALAEARQSAKNQEQYRRDEAEDLRVLHDAQEEQITKLQKELEDAQRELDLRDDELEELKQKLSTEKARADAKVTEDERTLDETDGDNGMSKDSSSVATERVSSKVVSELEEQLYNSTETINKLEQQIEELKRLDAENKAAFEQEKQSIATELKKSPSAKGKEDDEFRSLKSHWEEQSNAVTEVRSLKKEMEALLQRIHESSEAEKSAQKKVQQLEVELQRMESKLSEDAVRRELDSNQTEELTALRKELEVAKQKVNQSNDEVSRLKKVVEALNDEKDVLVPSIQQLKDAQSALATLNQEMKRELEKKDEEISRLRALEKEVESLRSEKAALEDSVKQAKSTEASGAISGSDDTSNLKAMLSDLSAQNEMLRTKLKDRDTTIATLVRSSVVLEKKIASLEGQTQSKPIDNEYRNETPGSSRVQPSNEDKLIDQINYLKKELRVAKADAKRWKRALKEDGTPGSEYRMQISLLQKANEDYAETIQERDQAIQNLVNQSMAQESHVRDLKTRVSSLMKEVEKIRMQKGRPDDASQAEIRRLQEESEIFAGQIIEQDEELKRMLRELKSRDDVIVKLNQEVATLQTKAHASVERNISVEDPGLLDELEAMKSVLAARDAQLSQQREQIEELKLQTASAAKLRAELDEMHEATESNRVELRDLRKQLWEANEAVGSTNDLRLELEQAQYALEEFKRQNSSAGSLSDEDKARLESELKRNADLLDTKTELESRVNELQNQLEDRESVISELRRQLSDANAGASDEDGVSKDTREVELKSLQDEVRQTTEDLTSSRDEVLALRQQLEEKSANENLLSDQLKASQDEVHTSRQEMDIKTAELNVLQQSVTTLKEEIESLRKEIKTHEEESGQLEEMQTQLDFQSKTISDLQAQLSDKELELKDTLSMKASLIAELSESQGRLHALEKELADVASANSSNEDLIQKNKSLAVENASLLQKNESLTAWNAELAADNGALCGELQSLGQRLDVLNEAHNALKNETSSRSASSSSEKEAQEKENADLRVHVDELQQANDRLGKEVELLSQNINALEREKSSTTKEKESLEEHIYTLKNDLQSLSEKNASLADQHGSLQEQQASFDLTIKSLTEENDALKETIQELQDRNDTLSRKAQEMTSEIQRLNAEVDRMSEEVALTDEYKLKLEQAGQGREASEKSIVETYEKQLAALTSAKDAEIDSLQNSLAESRGRTSEEMEEMIMQMKAMEEHASGMQEHYEMELQAKEQQIYALEHTLHAQEQIVDSMRAEMDQLQSGMEHATKSRRSEVEEMQQEVMQVEARAMRQEREIVALKMQIEENKLEHRAEVLQLKDALAAANQESPLKKTITDLQNNDKMLEVRERLEQLKARNTALQEENLKLGGRLERAAIQINAFELEKKQAEEIEEENVKLRHQLKEYEQLLSRSAPKQRGASFPAQEIISVEGESMMKSNKQKKKGKFGLFKRRNIDEAIVEEKDEEEI